MKLLALDTGTETMSLAVRSGDGLWQHSAAGGARASAALIPAVRDLMAQAGLKLGELDAIAFGCGPGSFTGLRTACSVAQGLAFGAGVPVLPVDSLMAVAEEARHAQGATRVLALLDARMDEIYAGHYVFGSGDAGSQWRRQEDFLLLQPEDLKAEAGWVLAGNVFEAYGHRLPTGLARVPAWPGAASILRLAPALLRAGEAIRPEQALPRYIRDKVARTTDEREADRAAKQVLAAT